MSAPVKFLTVPKGTPAKQCRGVTCHATLYWITSETGARVPVDCFVEGGHEPTEHEDGQGVSHFTTCPDANQFSS